MLNIDQFFYKALRTDADIIEVTEGRIFNTARDDQDETEDRIPYLIITFDGAQSTGNKDLQVATLDTATVSILCVAQDREALADLTTMAYNRIIEAMEDTDWDDETDWDFCIDGMSISASAVQMDTEKPCLYQTLTYQCDTQTK